MHVHACGACKWTFDEQNSKTLFFFFFFFFFFFTIFFFFFFFVCSFLLLGRFFLLVVLLEEESKLPNSFNIPSFSSFIHSFTTSCSLCFGSNFLSQSFTRSIDSNPSSAHHQMQRKSPLLHNRIAASTPPIHRHLSSLLDLSI
jgi:hypothetical protein